tara:strand:- start:424 stop:645 length:222 start_codon:yes stop_codon:yes gene_type:complete
MKWHKSFFTKSHLAEAYGTNHIPVGLVTRGTYEHTYVEGHPPITYVDVLWQKKSPAGTGGPGIQQKPYALAKL